MAQIKDAYQAQIDGVISQTYGALRFHENRVILGDLEKLLRDNFGIIIDNNQRVDHIVIDIRPNRNVYQVDESKGA